MDFFKKHPDINIVEYSFRKKGNNKVTPGVIRLLKLSKYKKHFHDAKYMTFIP